MNCYTVKDGKVYLGIALEKDEENRSFFLRLGKKHPQGGGVEKIAKIPSPSWGIPPASHVLVAGGVHLMRTVKLLKIQGNDDALFFAQAKIGLAVDKSDPSCLVLLDFSSKSSTAGYIPKTYGSIPLEGFEVLRSGGSDERYHVQSLVILHRGQCIRYLDASTAVPLVVSYQFELGRDRYPRLTCQSPTQHRLEESRKLVEV